MLMPSGSVLFDVRQDGYEIDYRWSRQDDKGVLGAGLGGCQVCGACIRLETVTVTRLRRTELPDDRIA